MTLKLTERQQKLVSAFLQKVDREAGDLSASERAQSLARVRARLQRELAGHDEERLSDHDLAAAMVRCQPAMTPAPPETKAVAVQPPPAAAEPELKPKPAPGLAAAPVSEPPSTRTRREMQEGPLISAARGWLGVCLALSETLRVNVYAVRCLFVLLGLGTGPVALLLYLALFAVLYGTAGEENRPQVQFQKLGKSIAVAIAAGMGLYGISWSVTLLCAVLFERFVGRLPEIGSWGWLEHYQNPLLAAVLAAVLPFAGLSALPAPNNWDYTTKKLAQAGIAIYLVILSIGLASTLVGTLLLVVDEFVG